MTITDTENPNLLGVVSEEVGCGSGKLGAGPAQARVRVFRRNLAT
jgi:hypothetical protein